MIAGNGDVFSVTISHSPNDHNMLEAQLREVYGRIVYTHKTHEKMADLLTSRYNVTQWIQTILSGLTTTSLLVVIFGNSEMGAVIAAFLSAFLFMVNLYLQNNNLGQRVERHTEVAAVLWGIRESYLTLITDLLTPVPNIDYIKAERDRLQDISERVFRNAPRTNAKAYRLAQNALKNNEELTFSEDELDLLLPEELRKGKRRKRMSNSDTEQPS